MKTIAISPRVRAINGGALALGIVLAASAFAVGCDDDDDADPEGTPTATSTTAPTQTETTSPTETATTPSDGAQIVDVTIDEVGILVPTATVAEGEVTFAVTNNGAVAHEVMVVKTDESIDLLPVDDDGMLAEDEVEVVDEGIEVAAGETVELTVTLEPGRYLLVDNLVGNFAAGLVAEITVEGS